ncbi:hypothetical protein NG895_01915 [Aeoliella sp. ICT_H6.2]|uniref:DUF4142 domain-containing protein n=1 Tax=Aeoliella straminimaris TaxID=2954799 RepID=A0A9X2F6U0_9BACT|nr:hypothetical protein [Aeoliella straminimaris]MCO6042652.1 hypothetical protein [Aeoliella straminimaris]
MKLPSVISTTFAALFGFLLIPCLPTHGQTQTQPPPQAPPYAGSEPSQYTPYYGGGGWGGNGGGYHSSTAAGDAMQGMASAISAQGSKNLNDSLAARNIEAARSANIDNRSKHVEQYRWREDSAKARQQQEIDAMKAKNASWLDKKKLKPLTTEQYNPTTGTVNWPMLCSDSAYDQYRNKINELLAKRAQYGGLSMDEFMDLEKQIKDFRGAITADSKKYPKAAVSQALRFLLSMHHDLNEQFG